MPVKNDVWEILREMDRRGNEDNQTNIDEGASKSQGPPQRRVKEVLRSFNRKMQGKGSDYVPGRNQVPAMAEPTDPGYIEEEEDIA